jgi:hypothetical protein
MHDPCALAVLCDRLGLAPPVERSVWIDSEEVFGSALSRELEGPANGGAQPRG